MSLTQQETYINEKLVFEWISCCERLIWRMRYPYESHRAVSHNRISIWVSQHIHMSLTCHEMWGISIWVSCESHRISIWVSHVTHMRLIWRLIWIFFETHMRVIWTHMRLIWISCMSLTQQETYTNEKLVFESTYGLTHETCGEMWGMWCDVMCCEI